MHMTEQETRVDGAVRHVTDQKDASYRLLLEIRQGVEILEESLTQDPATRVRTARGTLQKRSASHVAGALLARALSLPRGELEAFLREGLRIYDEHAGSDRPYAFAEEPLPPSVPGGLEPPAKGPRTVKGQPGYRHRRKDGGERQDAVAVADERPGRRA